MQKIKKKSKKYFIVTGILFLLFIVFTILAAAVDVKPIGPEQSTVGFASINQFVFGLLGVNMLWYNITGWLGIVSLAVAFGFAVLGLFQLIKRKSIWKVDLHILLLGVFYFIMLVFYGLFEFVIINYRPVILEEGLEASYPSSHTMLVICIMVTAMLQFHYYLKNKICLAAADIICVFILGATVIGRLLSGVHWFTDIIAAVILSSALIGLYCSVLNYIGEKPAIVEQHIHN